MTVPHANPVRTLMELLDPFRPAIHDYVHDSQGLGAVTGLLTTIPPELGDRIGHAWSGLVRAVPDGELRQLVSHEDRLLLDLVVSMSDDRRSFSPSAGADRA